MQERARLVVLYEKGPYSMSELCAALGVSRRTGYKWWHRYLEEGLEGLADRSRAPRSCPHRTPEAVAELLVRARQKHPDWGPRKLLPWLAKRHPDVALPAPSTAGDILQRHGLVAARRRRRNRDRPAAPPRTPMHAPNDVWTADFKGEFRTRDGQYCYPLTVADGYSRYLLGCQALASTAEREAQPVFLRLFHQYGLPRVILTDNGVPFATPTALGRLSRLALWWIKLGIRPARIAPGHPEQNGRHERLHRTLKATTRPPAAHRRAQQRRFARFRREFNQERPHEALQQRTPSELYRPSSRPYPSPLPTVAYPAHYEVRRVSSSGFIRWRSEPLWISHALQGEQVGLVEVDDGLWSVYFADLLLGRFDEREKRLYG